MLSRHQKQLFYNRAAVGVLRCSVSSLLEVEEADGEVAEAEEGDRRVEEDGHAAILVVPREAEDLYSKAWDKDYATASQ